MPRKTAKSYFFHVFSIGERFLHNDRVYEKISHRTDYGEHGAGRDVVSGTIVYFDDYVKVEER